MSDDEEAQVVTLRKSLQNFRLLFSIYRTVRMESHFLVVLNLIAAYFTHLPENTSEFLQFNIGH